MTPDQTISLREFVERLIMEHDRRYEERFKAVEDRAISAITANKELTAAAFASSEKAIIKAEDAQKSYNERTNELRGALNDQNKTLLTRTEAETRFIILEQRLEESKRDSSKVHDDLRRELGDLRESRSQGFGKDEAKIGIHTNVKWFIALGIGTGLSLLGMLATAIYFILGK